MMYRLRQKEILRQKGIKRVSSKRGREGEEKGAKEKEGEGEREGEEEEEEEEEGEEGTTNTNGRTTNGRMDGWMDPSQMVLVNH
uniref:Uncharacterized protein n=1 Tax=Vespula pensylvanica TaxID=30213 RepID=A0A834NEF6_VESPE|nr:hypothetical protein H0235_015127 [Vespula pensylvanica]